MTELLGRVAIVTGGSRGIGGAVVRALASAGAHVVFSTRTETEEAAAMASSASDLGPGSALHVPADVASEEETDRLFARGMDIHGRIDVVVHCAGISRGALLVALKNEDLDAVLSTNATGAFLVARRTARDVSPSMPRTLVLVGSLAQHGSPANAAYAASKGALVGLTRSLAAEQRDQGLTAHLVVVGFVETNLTRDLPERARSLLIETCPQKRSATCEQVADAIVAMVTWPDALEPGEPVFISGGLTEIPA